MKGDYADTIIVGVTGHATWRRTSELWELVCGLQTLIRTLTADHAQFLASAVYCAEVAIELGVVLKCPLPTGRYIVGISKEDLIRYKAVLGQAEEVFIAPGTQPAPVD